MIPYQEPRFRTAMTVRVHGLIAVPASHAQPLTITTPRGLRRKVYPSWLNVTYTYDSPRQEGAARWTCEELTICGYGYGASGNPVPGKGIVKSLPFYESERSWRDDPFPDHPDFPVHLAPLVSDHWPAFTPPATFPGGRP